MPSLGESNIIIDSFFAGDFRARDIFAASAIYPRLGIVLECKLGERQEPEDRALRNYEMIDLCGEIRLEEQSKSIGPTLWLEKRQKIRSSTTPREQHLKVFCDLDTWRLERIEEYRKGEELKLWLQLWPTFRGKGSFWDIDVRPFRIEVPRDKWLRVLEGMEHGRYEILEIPRAHLDDAKFEDAMKHLTAARLSIDKGNYEETLRHCRIAIESFTSALKKTHVMKEKNDLKGILEVATDERRAKEYYGIISKLKELVSMKLHAYGSESAFSRVEVQFVTRTTENLLALLSKLTAESNV